MARFPIAPFTKGLNTLVDPAAGDPQASPQLSDVRGHTGILTLRKGYRVLDIEPSHVVAAANKVRVYLSLDGVDDYLTNASWTQTLGQNWTILMNAAFAFGGINITDGTRNLLNVSVALDADSVDDPVSIYLVGDTAGATISLRAFIRVADTTGIVLTSTARTIAQWTTLLTNSTDSFIRLVRDGNTGYLYCGETLLDSDTGLGTAAHSAAGYLYVGRTANAVSPGYAATKLRGSLVIVNRVLSEADAYWGINWPTDARMPQDVLGCWHFLENTGTTVVDYSSYAKNLSLSGGTWAGESHAAGRGLGVFSWRRGNGDIYHTVAASRRATDSSNNKASGALYTWKAKNTFTPFYFGGVVANDETTAGLDELSLFARWDLVQGRDMAIMSNGVDYCRKYQSAYKYLGGTAPPTAPVVVTSGGVGITATWLYAYSYYNPTEGTETGLSPTTSISITDDVGCSVTFFDSSDSQFTKVRIYRSQNAETALYLVAEVAAASGAYADTKTDVTLRAGPLCSGSDISGNRGRKRAYLAFPSYGDGPTLFYTPRGTARTFPTGSSRGPGAGPALAQSNTGSGALTLTNVYYVSYSYYDSVNAVETGLSQATAITLTGVNDTIDVSGMVLPPEGSRFDKIKMYRTAGNGVVWYLDQTIAAATTATLVVADATLTTQENLATACLPPRFEGMTVFANRLWGFVGPTLFWSTSGSFEDHPESNGFAPKAGVDITATNATEGALFVHFKDGTIHLLPHPGDEPDLAYFVPINLKEWSPIGGSIGHFTSQRVPGGAIWLAKDGFYFANETTLEKISHGIDPSFSNLNVFRGPNYCSLFDRSRRIYRCWVSRGSAGLSDECFVYYMDEGTWWLDSIHADAAGVLYDPKETPHYCFIVENGVLCELDETLDYDGDGSGTVSAAVAGAGVNHMTEMVSYTPPVGGDGGYPVWFLKTDGTMVQRYRLDAALSPSAVNFYPSYSGLTSGTWAAHFHGIRGYIKTMLLHLGDLRHPKNLQAVFFFNRVQSAGDLQVNLATDEGTLTAMNTDVDLTKPVSQVTTGIGSGRVFQFEIYSDPPAASRPWGLKGMEIEGTVDQSDVGSEAS